MKQKKLPLVIIVIVTYNPELKILEECLSSLKKNTDYENYKVIVSDNGSTNGSNKIIKKDFKWVDLLENNANLYFAGGNNKATKYALKKYNPDYFFVLNDDIKVINKKWLSEIVKTAESDPKIGLVGINPIYPDGISQNVGGYIKGPLITLDKEAEGFREFDHITALFLVKKEVIEKIGLFDEIFVPYLLEETDYCLRTKRAGFKVVSRADIKIIHYKGLTIDRDKEVNRNYARMKNDLIFSLINLKIHFAFIRIFFYLPLVMILKKKTDKKKISLSNIKFRQNILINLLNIIKGYYYVITHFEIIYKKWLERKRNSKIWY